MFTVKLITNIDIIYYIIIYLFQNPNTDEEKKCNKF